jgi:GAF domain-containing protein
MPPSHDAAPIRGLAGSFSVRLRDLLCTLESTALLGASEGRVRGLGEHLRFACLALPCSEALLALEIEALGRLSIPVVASPEAWRTTNHEFLPSGTPFAYLLGGGGGHAAEITQDDPMIACLQPLLSQAPTSGLFVPIRLGDSIVGGAALLSHETHFSDRHLEMAERLSEVLALTVESFRTEQVIFELFARALPDLLGEDAVTSLPAGLMRHIHALRVTPTYRRRLDLAVLIGRLADRGPAEARLAAEILTRVDDYARSLEGFAAAPDGEFP